VPRALVGAGLPESSVAGFLTAYTNGTQAALAAVQGLNPTALEVGTRAYKNASADAYRTVFLTTIAFSGVGVILTWFIPEVDAKLRNEVVVQLSEKADGGILCAEAGISTVRKA